jgi:hypothetical protein
MRVSLQYLLLLFALRRINYPYLTNDIMNSTSAEVHALGMRYSVYNTMRELSNRCAEVCCSALCESCPIRVLSLFPRDFQLHCLPPTSPDIRNAGNGRLLRRRLRIFWRRLAQGEGKAVLCCCIIGAFFSLLFSSIFSLSAPWATFVCLSAGARGDGLFVCLVDPHSWLGGWLCHGRSDACRRTVALEQLLR